MNKRTVAFFSNYDASEKTFCALYLAEHILKRYRYSIWVVPEDVPPRSRYHGFSHKWDRDILSLASQSEKIKDRLDDCEFCFFFEESEALRSLLPDSTKTAVFLDPHKWNDASSRAFAKKCNFALSTSPFITKKIVRRNLLANNVMCPFDHFVQMIPKVWIQSGEAATLFYPAYGMSFIERQCLKQISAIVKTCCPESKSVIGYYDNNERSESGVDARTYDWKLMEYLKQTDWIIDLNPRPLMGLFACFAGALSIQWSCFELPPSNDEYSAARRHLIPFPEGGLTLDNAPVIADCIVRQLSTPFNDDAARNLHAGSYSKRLLEFGKTLNSLFGYKSR
jgi:hypothetical protein